MKISKILGDLAFISEIHTMQVRGWGINFKINFWKEADGLKQNVSFVSEGKEEFSSLL